MAKARLGQNFLVDGAAQQRIVDALGNVRDRVVLEIGPGKAAITDRLVERAGKLVVVELDPTLAAGLRARFGPRIEVVEDDVLRVDLSALASRIGGEGKQFAVVGNLPYYITSDILLHLFAHSAVVKEAVVMVQREVADRIVAEPGTRDFGMLSATCQLHARCERLFSLPPESFQPAPEVWSSVVRMSFAPRFAELAVEPQLFLAYLRASFAQKRKTLANNLRAAGYAAGLVSAALAQVATSPQVRSEALSLEQQARIFRALGPAGAPLV